MSSDGVVAVQPAERGEVGFVFVGERPSALQGLAFAYANPGNPVVTPSVRVGKFSAYQSCYQTVPGGVWNCAPSTWRVYLGDG